MLTSVVSQAIQPRNRRAARSCGLACAIVLSERAYRESVASVVNRDATRVGAAGQGLHVRSPKAPGRHLDAFIAPHTSANVPACARSRSVASVIETATRQRLAHPDTALPTFASSGNGRRPTAWSFAVTQNRAVPGM